MKQVSTRSALRYRSLEQERARTVALFRSIGDGVIAADQHGVISDVNQQALKLLGYKRKELVGKWLPHAIPAFSQDGLPVELIDRPGSRAMLDGRAVTESIIYRTADGSYLPVSVTASPVMVNGRPRGMIQVFRDITHEIEIDRMKSEFISIASHQLRTPLSAIKTYSHMLAGGFSGKLNKQQAEFLNIILNSADRMNELINTLLDISRIEEGGLVSERQFVSLEKTTQEILTEMKPAAKAKKLTIKVDYATDDLNAITDRILAKEVCSNLLSNAIKYTPTGGRIKLRLTADDQTLTFSVKDNGYGIPEKEQGRIFTKFFRAENILNKDTSGTGLGLYLVKQIAESLGGSISFTSKEGKGSEFVFSLPR